MEVLGTIMASIIGALVAVWVAHAIKSELKSRRGEGQVAVVEERVFSKSECGGVDYGEGWMECPLCQGHGRVKHHMFSDRYVICPKCKGQKRIKVIE